MKKTFTILIAAIAAILMMAQPIIAIGQAKPDPDPTVLFHETFGNNSNSAREWNDSYSVKSGISTVYSGITGYTVSNVKQGKNTTGYVNSGLNQSTSGTDAYIIIGPLNVANYKELKVTYYWNPGSIKKTYNRKLYYATSQNGTYSEIDLYSGDASTSFNLQTFNLPEAAQVQTLYLKAVWNTSNTQAIIDEFELNCPTYTITYDANGATSGSAPAATTHASGSNATLATKPDGFAKSGCSFDGWYSNATGTGGTTYAAGGTYPSISSNVTLYAKWVAEGTPSITASDVNLTQSATSGSIAYEISNPEDGGVLTANIIEGNTGSWLSIGTITSSAVGLSCSANNGAERSATVRLTYTYGTKSTTTKDVVVTQAPPQFNVTYDKNGGSGSMTGDATDYDYGSTVTVLENKYTAPTGKMFNCWNDKADGTGNRTYKKDDEFTITSNITLYAQWVNEPTFSLVTDISQIVPGAHCIIANGKGNSASIYAMGYQKSNNRDAVSVSTTSDGKIKNPGEDIYQFVISGYEDNWTFYDTKNKVDNQGFLYAVKNSNHLKNKSTLADDCKWSISIDNDNHATITVTFDPNTNNPTIREMRYNGENSNSLFSCYTSSMADVYLYIKDNDTDIHPYSSSEYSSGSVTINDAITLSANYNITVGAGATVRFTTTPNCTNASWLTVAEGGQLIIPAAKTDVKATFQRDITGYGQSTGKDYYYLIANPTTEVEGINPDDVGMLDNNYDLYYFDESIPGIEWRNYKKVPFKLVNGKGYLYANSSSFTIEFPGTVRPGTTASINLSKSGSGTYNGFNLVGNPLSNNITSMYIDNVDCPYYYLDDAGSFQSIAAELVSANPVKVGCGFMVQATDDDQVLTLNTIGSKGFTDEVIRLEVSNDKYTDAAYISFGNSLPLTKINHLNDEAPMIYIHEANADNAVAVYNNRGEVKSINVNFEAKTIGTYTISAKMVKGEIKYMHLYDRFTGIDTDLLIDDYSFIGANEDQPGRFILKLEAIDNEFEGSDNFAYQSGNNIMVNGEGELQIFDVMGRMVMNERINGVESISGLSRGIYIFRVIGETQKTQKIVVR